MSLKNQRGFAHIVAVLVIIVLAAVGGSGYYVWHKNHDKKPASNNSQTTKKVSSIKNYDECTKTHGSKIQKTYPQICVTKDGQHFTRPTTQKYLTIKEWGVRIPLTSNINDAYYVYDSSIDTVYLSKISYRGTNCSADGVTLGALERYNVNSTKQQVSNANSIKIGGYYYFYQHPQSGCDGQVGNNVSDFNSAKANVAGQYMLDFKSAVDNLITE